MNSILRIPTSELVRVTCDTFDRNNLIVKQALSELFSLFVPNTNLPHVLLKVVTLNRLYSTQILAVMDVARHIHDNAKNIDSALSAGSHEIVDKIAKVTIQGKVYNFFSFATKYCSWHNPKSYPIYDSRVDKYLWSLRKQERFTEDPFAHDELWDYPKFLQIMSSFRDHYGLGSFTFKEIDKFLWLEGEGPTGVETNPDAESPQVCGSV